MRVEINLYTYSNSSLISKKANRTTVVKAEQHRNLTELPGQKCVSEAKVIVVNEKALLQRTRLYAGLDGNAKRAYFEHITLQQQSLKFYVGYKNTLTVIFPQHLAPHTSPMTSIRGRHKKPCRWRNHLKVLQIQTAHSIDSISHRLPRLARRTVDGITSAR
jgi:hypothetical protein